MKTLFVALPAIACGLGQGATSVFFVVGLGPDYRDESRRARAGRTGADYRRRRYDDLTFVGSTFESASSQSLVAATRLLLENWK